MNEKLILEFTKKATEVHQPKPHSNSTENSVVFNKEKFAELIVQECISTIQWGMCRDGHNTSHYQQSKKHIDDIKKKFGVE